MTDNEEWTVFDDYIEATSEYLSNFDEIKHLIKTKEGQALIKEVLTDNVIQEFIKQLGALEERLKEEDENSVSSK